MTMAAPRGFFSQNDEQAILAAIRAAEQRTSGELRVRIEARAGGDPLAAARRAFEALGMRATALRNGVLFYLAIEDRAFAILGDDAIHAKVPDGFWDGVRDEVLAHFREQRFAAGLAAGVARAGAQLAASYPRADADADELPDAISYGDDADGAR